jgi:hypothetical protein
LAYRGTGQLGSQQPSPHGLLARGREQGSSLPRHRSTAPRLNSGGPGDEVQRGGSGEQGGRVVYQFWGGGEEEPHQKNELGEVWSAEEERQWGAASGVGGRQLTAREVHTRLRGARGVVEEVEDGLEQAGHGGLATVSKAAQGQ